MKNPFRPAKKQVSTESSKAKHPVASSQDVKAFLSKVATLPKGGGEARMIFALDATASRQPTWDVASQLQTEMFLATQALGGLKVQLAYFQGFNQFFSSDWQSQAEQLMSLMGQIQCEAGATQIERLLLHAIEENQGHRIKCLVYVGDAVEESLDRLAHLAGKLGLLNVPVFMFQEQGDPVARQAFMEISRLSGGAYCQFDRASAGQLRELLKAVAIYAAGGLKALEDFSKGSNAEVKLLQQQLKA